MKTYWIFLVWGLALSACTPRENLRKEMSLNGTWQIAKTASPEQYPAAFGSEAPVPGLVDMATPSLDKQDTAYTGAVYWYRRTFASDHTEWDVVRLKINKAKYHTRVFLNGVPAGENTYNFTPTVLDVKPFLKPAGELNELVIAVGCKDDLPDSVTHGGDFEKTKYMPGIYDDVKLIHAGFPLIGNVQTAPDLDRQQLRVAAEIRMKPGTKGESLNYVVREAGSKKIIARGSAPLEVRESGDAQRVDFTIPMDGARLWSPEDPFLYELEVTTAGDRVAMRFGMRTFTAAPSRDVFLLNGKPYYMRGTNVCIFRFFEDPDRAGLPWDRQWVTTLHERFKDMHWNSIRYCIGFPPESWYEVADSLGFLIQDEYPIWTGGKGGFETHLGGLSARQLAEEYRQWMRERWNHPCVVIWDAQNESVNDTTAKAIALVRPLDLSGRPWDNGWAAPASATDAIESHPYLFTQYFRKTPGPEGHLKELMAEPQTPENGPDERTPRADGARYGNPVIINEYGWIWLNRNGTPTTLTDAIYERLYPWADTPEERLEIYARTLAIKTEYWRAHRQAAGVLHFCGLGYSRPDPPRGQTSDNFTDIRNLIFEPHFYEYVKPAFAPVGLMIDYWEQEAGVGTAITLPVHIVNDTYDTLENELYLRLYRDQEVVAQERVAYRLDPLQTTIVDVEMVLPAMAGSVRLEAETLYRDERITSRRDWELK
jgi:beta-galactosidase